MYCTELFPKTALKFEEILSKNIDSCLLISFSNISDVIGRILTGLQLSSCITEAFFENRSYFNDGGNYDRLMASLKSRKLSFG